MVYLYGGGGGGGGGAGKLDTAQCCGVRFHHYTIRSKAWKMFIKFEILTFAYHFLDNFHSPSVISFTHTFSYCVKITLS